MIEKIKPLSNEKDQNPAATGLPGHNLLPMIEVFKTNVRRAEQAKKLLALLHQSFPGSKINFDLDDCDKVLRVEGKDFMVNKIIGLIEENGFECNILDS